MPDSDLGSLLKKWDFGFIPSAVYVCATARAEYLFAVSGEAPSETLNAAPPVALKERALAMIPSGEKLFAYSIHPKTGELKGVPKLTEERKRVFELAEKTEQFITASKPYSDKPLGGAKAEKVIRRLRKVEVLGGKDIHNTYDSCTLGGGFLIDGSGKFVFGDLTLNEDGTRDVDVFVSESEAKFKVWLAKQSLRSLIQGKVSLKNLPATYSLNKSLIQDLELIE